MTRTLRAVVAAALLTVGVVGCGSSAKDIAGTVCNKAGTCNALSGITVDGCKNLVNQSFASMTSAARSDAETALDTCVRTADCTTIGTCLETGIRGQHGLGWQLGRGQRW